MSTPRPPGPHRKPPADRPTLGARGEQLAVDHLEAEGLAIVDRNWRCRWGEIDIVAAEPVPDGRRRLVFCEVKTRSGRGYGSPLEAVTYAKLQRLRRLAGHWLEARGGRAGGGEWAEIRLDVVGVLLDGGTGTPEIDHVKAVG
ncbi:putative endonuclease [Friedmanniella endophytica]|uniref:UPF0102 protein FHX74_003324 n=1 Tax=Microlunatus kandeliicorticis TaxID=1759536 RepID=A0A7W3P762_9ACTN|nr:YraN family protein [Microlunatus kandeliicorticis]MBA8795688.1 putative endonuclease [Microlunatus kandeliicorticis]